MPQRRVINICLSPLCQGSLASPGRFFLDFNPACFALIVEYLQKAQFAPEAAPHVPPELQQSMDILAEARSTQKRDTQRCIPTHGHGPRPETDMLRCQPNLGSVKAANVLGRIQPFIQFALISTKFGTESSNFGGRHQLKFGPGPCFFVGEFLSSSVKL